MSEWVRQKTSVYRSNNNNNNNYYINYQRRVNWSAIGDGRCSHAQTRIYTELWRRRRHRYTVSSLFSLFLYIFLHTLSLTVCLTRSRSGHQAKQYWSGDGGGNENRTRNGPPSSILLLHVHTTASECKILFLLFAYYDTRSVYYFIQSDRLNIHCIIAVQPASVMPILRLAMYIIGTCRCTRIALVVQ